MPSLVAIGLQIRDISIQELFYGVTVFVYLECTFIFLPYEEIPDFGDRLFTCRNLDTDTEGHNVPLSLYFTKPAQSEQG